VLLVDGADGKLEPDGIIETVTRRSDVHYPKPRAVSVTQVTELWTVYRPADVEAIGETCRTHGLRLHMDGARFAQAVAALGVEPKTISWQAGVDVLCLGGTKRGMPVGEMLIFFDRALATEFEYRCKQAGQLAVKMRFLAAPWLGMLEGDVWLTHARHANSRAAALADKLRAIPGVTFLSPTEANSVFVDVPAAIRDGLRNRGWSFYTFIGEGRIRLMCSWDTTNDDVKSLANNIADLAETG
jgi:threonine aldolase